MNKMTLSEQAQKILEKAEQKGVEQNFFFVTTFKRYQVQLNALAELEKKIKEDGTLVTKTYVKGRENIYCNPALKEYNNTCTCANRTVDTLIKIVNSIESDTKSNKLKELFGSDNE